MAIKVNISLTTNQGVLIPTGSLIVPKLTFPRTKSIKDEEGNITPYRRVDYLMIINSSVESYLNDETPFSEGVKEFDREWSKVYTEEESIALEASGMLAQIWLRDHLISVLGIGTCEITDPFTV